MRVPAYGQGDPERSTARLVIARSTPPRSFLARTVEDMTRERPEDVVPAADRQEQETPRVIDPRLGHPHDPDQPEADVLEQELPIDDAEDEVGVDDDRLEPIDDADWFDEQADH